MKAITALSGRDIFMVAAIAAIFILAVVYSVFSATTIDNNVNTGGTLTVSGASTLTGAVSVAGAVYATSTLQSTGDGLFYANLSAGASTNSPTTTFNVTGSGYFTGGLGAGFATTAAGQLHVKNNATFDSDILLGTGRVMSSTGTTTLSNDAVTTNITANGRVGVNATSSPYKEFGVTGSTALGSAATTTLSIESSTATVGGCIELKSSDTASTNGTRWIRIYVGGFGATTTYRTAVVQASGRGLLIVEEGRCQ